MNETEIAKFRKSLDDLRSALPLLIQNVSLTAQITKAKYEALRKEGFTEQQAIELCRTGTSLV